MIPGQTYPAPTAPAVPADSLAAATQPAAAPSATTGAGTQHATIAADIARDARPGVDSLPFPLCGTADSLRHVLPATDSPYRIVPAEAVFGTASTAAPRPALPLPPEPSLTMNAFFQGFVLLLAAAYALLLYDHLGDIRTVFSRISRDRAAGNRLQEGPGGSNTLMRLLNISAVIGVLLVGVVTVKYGDSLLPPPLREVLSHAAVPALSLMASAAATAVVCYQLAVLRTAGALTLTQPFISQLLLLKRTYFALAVTVSAPLLLLYALCPPASGEGWFWVIAIVLLVTVLLYLRETLSLFISKKISILHWFLYLCTVEIFPLSLVWLALGR